MVPLALALRIRWSFDACMQSEKVPLARFLPLLVVLGLLSGLALKGSSAEVGAEVGVTVIHLIWCILF